MSEYLDPEYSGTFGNPDASLQDWLSNPAAVDFVKQKAAEHAAEVLGFADPSGNNIDPNSGMPTNVPMTSLSSPSSPIGLPTSPPTQNPDAKTTSPFPRGIPADSIFGRLGFGQSKAPAAPGPEPITLNPSGVRSAASTVTPNNPNGLMYGPEAPPNYGNSLDPSEENPSPVEKGTTPLPKENPTRNTEASSQKKTKNDKEDAISDFAKTLGAIKPIAPPPLNPVGTPGVRSPSAINAPQISQLLQLMGAQSRPDPIQTLGRLLVAGKA